MSKYDKVIDITLKIFFIMERYEHKIIEQKWREEWDKSQVYKTTEDKEKEKFYILDMFPYPSGEGLHVGHPKGYIATDIISRYKKMQNFNVLHPMGWDAFGLPAEQYALKNKVHPRIGTDKNIATFKKQLEKISLNYDWDREISTTDPEFYKWTQWTFIQMYKKGLVYQSNEPINWCPSCKTGLANEDLENGACERCDTPIEKKKMPQWVIKITDYADRMLADIDKLDWQESIKESQRNWIGRSEGSAIEFGIKNEKLKIEVFTTRPDTLYGATYMVLAPEHELIENLKFKIENWNEVTEYQKAAQTKTEIERTAEGKEKTGVKLEGMMAVNPVNGEEIPIFVADYVLAGYGTGAIMAVPAHDERDFEFATKYNIDIKQVIAPDWIGKGDGAPRDDKETLNRKVVDMIIENQNGQFLLQKDSHWHFVGGGIQEGENIEEAVKREVLEETGYVNITIEKKIIDEVSIYGFRETKDKNQKVKSTLFHVKVLDDEQVNSEIDEGKHIVKWVDRKKVEEGLEWRTHKLFWDIFNRGVFTGAGIMINSGEFDGLNSEEAKEKITQKANGEMTTSYRLRDWVFSRQRYWGEPMPLIHCEKCGVVTVPEDELPLILPDVESYEPTGTGESPLAAIDEWVNTDCPQCNGPAKRETNTMPQWAGSSWYFIRYIDPKNNNALIDKEKEKYWSPVDFNVGGAGHATRHLIYARFWYKFLYDIGVVSYDEPFAKLQTVGLIVAEDGRKMSKRWGNVINPDEVIEKFGSDTFRLYEMFMGPFDASVAWSTDGLIGPRKFLEKIWKIYQKGLVGGDTSDSLEKTLHKTIKKVGSDIEEMKYNTAISSMMMFVNQLEKEKNISMDDFGKFLTILSPFAPHMTQELWDKMENKTFLIEEKWPEYNEKYLIDDEIELVVQVNGKVRDKIMVATDITEDDAKEKALESEKVKKYIDEKEIKKVIFVQGKLISIVV